MPAKIGDLIYITYKGDTFITEVRRIKERTLYLYDTIAKTDTSLTWNEDAKEWSLPNGAAIPYSDVRISSPNRAPSLPEAEPNFRFTDHESTDLHLLALLPHSDFIQACRTSKYSRALCNGIQNNRLYRERVQLHFPEEYASITDTRLVKNWRKLYYRIGYWKRYIDRGHINEKEFPRTIPEMEIFMKMCPEFREGFRYAEEEIVWEAFKLENEEAEDLILWYLKRRISVLFTNPNYLRGVYANALQHKYKKLVEYLEKNEKEKIKPDQAQVKHEFLNGNVKFIDRVVDDITPKSDGIELLEFNGDRVEDNDLKLLVQYNGGNYLTISYDNLLHSDLSLPTLKYLYKLDIPPALIDLYRAIENGPTNIIKWLIEVLVDSLTPEQRTSVIRHADIRDRQLRADGYLARVVKSEIDKYI